VQHVLIRKSKITIIELKAVLGGDVPAFSFLYLLKGIREKNTSTYNVATRLLDSAS